jgi:hypothetical protein
MKLTKSGLKRIIQEETHKLLQEWVPRGDDDYPGPHGWKTAETDQSEEEGVGIVPMPEDWDPNYGFAPEDPFPSRNFGPISKEHWQDTGEQLPGSGGYIGLKADYIDPHPLDTPPYSAGTGGRGYPPGHPRRRDPDPPHEDAWETHWQGEPPIPLTYPPYTVTKEHLTRIIDEVLKKLV